MAKSVLAHLSEAQIAFMRDRSLNDTIYLAREVLGFNKSDIRWEDPDTGEEHGETRYGDEYGISRLSPHSRMAALLDRPSLRKHMEAPRGSYKTTLLQCWIIRHMLRDRNVRVFYAMATEPEALKTLEAIKALLQNETLVALFGPQLAKGTRGNRIVLTGRTDATRLRDPSFQVGALDLERTGVHCDIMVVDDIVTKKMCRTPQGFKTVEDYWNSLQHFPVGGCIVVENGTRYADHDLHSTFLKPPRSNSYDSVVLGCGYEIVKDEHGLPTLEAIPGKEDEQFPFMDKKYLLDKLHSTDEREFSMQYCNLCLPSGLAYFQREQFLVCQWEEWMSEMPAYMVTDVATSADEEGCFSVVALLALDAIRRSYLLDLWIEKCLSTRAADAALDMLVDWSERIAIQSLLIEDQTLSRMFQSIIEERLRDRQLRLHLEGIKVGTGEPSKKQRIEGLTGRFQQHRFLVVQTFMKRAFDDFGTKELWNPEGFASQEGTPKLPSGELVDQFVRYPSYGWMDIPDAISLIDARDKHGNYICRGSGKKQERRIRDLKGRAGRYFMPGKVNGVETLVEVARTDHAGGHYGKLARHLGV